MGEFIERNKNWLNKFHEFRIHLSSVETKFGYRMEEGSLILEKEDVFKEGSHEAIDLGHWIYIQGEGFFSRKEMMPQAASLEPIEIDELGVSNFIHKHKEELETIKGFYTLDTGLEKTGLEVHLESGQIVIEPKYFFKEWASLCAPKVYGDFVYLKGKGFAEIPDNLKLPSKYENRVDVPLDQIPYFIKHELKRLKSQILHLDKRLIEPTRLKLVIRGVKREKKGWLIEFVYTSAYGEVP